MRNFEYNTLQAKIQGLSVQVGELFADLYRAEKQGNKTLEALEAYKSLRRLLPMENFGYGARAYDRHIGATAAHKATQGIGTRTFDVIDGQLEQQT